MDDLTTGQRIARTIRRIMRVIAVAILVFAVSFLCQTFGALKGAHPIMEAFDFSVSDEDEQVIRDLESVALSGERVNLHYVSRYVAFPWRGDTKYFIVKVDRLGQ